MGSKLNPPGGRVTRLREGYGEPSDQPIAFSSTRCNRAPNAGGSSTLPPSRSRASSSISQAASSISGLSLPAPKRPASASVSGCVGLISRIGLARSERRPWAASSLLELPIGTEFRRDETGHAVGQPFRGANLGDLALQRLLEESKQRRDFARRFLGRLRAFDERDRLDVGRALGDRLERLAFEAGRARDPERIDRIGQQQDLDASRAETLELGARGEPLGVVAGQIKDRRLVFAQAGDVLRERAVAGRMGRRDETGDLVDGVPPFGILIEALLDDRRRNAPRSWRICPARPRQACRAPGRRGW